MRIITELELSKNELPTNYKETIISLIKSSFDIKDTQLFKEMYGGNKQKNFTFDVKMDNPKFQEDRIILDTNKIKITFSTSDLKLGVDIYNSLINRKNKSHPLPNGNCMAIKRFDIKQHEIINDEEIIVKFYSPLVVRNHNKETNKDKYYFYNEDGFEENLNICLKNQMINCGMESIADNRIEIIPINPKTMIAKIFGLKIPGSLGTYKIKGPIENLNYLYQAGMGSRRNAGFGTFEIIG